MFKYTNARQILMLYVRTLKILIVTHQKSRVDHVPMSQQMYRVGSSLRLGCKSSKGEYVCFCCITYI